MIEALIIVTIIFVAVGYGHEMLLAATSLPWIGDVAGWTLGTLDEFIAPGPLGDLVCGLLLVQLLLMALGIILHGPRLATAVYLFMHGGERTGTDRR